jgi:thiosulfate reductase/polysulfide reductase chain A
VFSPPSAAFADDLASGRAERLARDLVVALALPLPRLPPTPLSALQPTYVARFVARSGGVPAPPYAGLVSDRSVAGPASAALAAELETYFPWEDIEGYLDTRLRLIGSSLEEARAQGTLVQRGRPYLTDWEARGLNPFATPSGTIELSSSAFAEAGFDPLPTYEPPAAAPTGSYRLLYGRSPLHTFAGTHNNWVLMEMHGENAVWLHAGEAARLGLANGDYVWLENQDGVREGPVPVKATERIRPDCVYLVHGFGHHAAGMQVADGRGASDNALISRYRLDPTSGGAGMRVNFVPIVPGAPRPRHPRLARLAERTV